MDSLPGAFILLFIGIRAAFLVHLHFLPKSYNPLRNAPTKLMTDLGYNKGYKWQANFQHEEGFLPPELNEISFFN